MGFTWDLQLKIYKYTLATAAVIALGAAILIRPFIPFFMGIIFGTLISMLNFRALALTLEKAVTLPPGRAQVYASSRYFIRLMTNGIVIFVSIKADYINVLGTIIGLIIIKLVVLGTNLLNDKSFYTKIFARKEED